MSCGTLYTDGELFYIIQSVSEILQVEGQAAAALNKRKRRGADMGRAVTSSLCRWESLWQSLGMKEQEIKTFLLPLGFSDNCAT